MENDMLAKLIIFAKPILFAAVAAMSLLGCSRSDDSAARFTLVGEEREVRGTVADAKLTACGPVSDKPGTCEGTLVVELGDGSAVTLPLTGEGCRGDGAGNRCAR